MVIAMFRVTFKNDATLLVIDVTPAKIRAVFEARTGVKREHYQTMPVAFGVIEKGFYLFDCKWLFPAFRRRNAVLYRLNRRARVIRYDVIFPSAVENRGKNRQVIVQRGGRDATFLTVIAKGTHISACDREDVQISFRTEEVQEFPLDLLVLLRCVFVLRFRFDLGEMFKPFPNGERAQSLTTVNAGYNFGNDLASTFFRERPVASHVCCTLIL